MPKVTIIGAGSAVFATEIMSDILATPALETGAFALVDIHPGRLELAHQMAEFLIERSGRRLAGGSQRRPDESAGRQRLRGAHYRSRRPRECPPRLRYPAQIRRRPMHRRYDWAGRPIQSPAHPTGLVGDPGRRRTAGAGRAGHELHQSHVPDRPGRSPRFNVAHRGLVPFRSRHTSRKACYGYLDLPQEEIDWRAAGINHLAWFVELARDGRDLYPLLLERIEKYPEIYEQDPVRFEMMRELGAFVTESSGHASEYTAYFRKRPELVKKYARSGYRGESGFYANNWPTWVEENATESSRAYLSGAAEYELGRGAEFASYIMEAVETGCAGRHLWQRTEQ